LLILAVLQLMLPLLQAKLPTETCCLEQILLLQVNHQQPVIPVLGSSPDDQAALAAQTDDAYKAAKCWLLQHWLAPHRYQMLTVLEKLLLAALEGRTSLARFAQDVGQRLESPAEKRGAKRSW
jgi:hypothetical protein